MRVFRSLIGVSRLLTKSTTVQSSLKTFASSPDHIVDLSGVFPPIPTPFTEKENIDWENLKLNLNKWENIDFRGELFL